MNAAPPRTTVAFVRVEQVLLPARAALGALALAAEAPGFGGRFGRLGALAGALPVLGALGKVDRRLQTRLAALPLRGLTHDRLEELAPELYDRFARGRLRASGLELIARARAHGHAVVLVSEAPELALGPLVTEVGADALLAARFELQGGLATGKLLAPEVAESLARVRAWARREGIELRGSYAYGVDLFDAPLLEAVTFPCAVDPDLRLRRLATRRGWPILETAEARP